MSRYLQDLETRFRSAWEVGLSKHGVDYPSGSHRWALLFLFEAMPESRSQGQIAQWYIDNDLGHYDRQIRHLAVKNWPLVTGNRRSTNMTVDMGMPSDHIRLDGMNFPNAIHSFANRSGSVSKLAWDEKVQAFEKARGGCAACGEKQASYDKGHLDRSKGMVEENVVPLCTGCNNHAQAYDFDFKLHPKSLKARTVPRGNW